MNLLALLDELRVHAKTGLHDAEDPYDRERYERILDLVSEYYGEAVDLPPEAVRGRFAAELGHVTPKVGGEATILDDQERILLIERADDRTWCLPCGWVDPGESPAETAVRDTREETGLDVTVVELLDVYHLPPGEQFGPHGQIAVWYRSERVGGELSLSREGDALQYWDVEDVPTWHMDHERFARDAVAAIADR